MNSRSVSGFEGPTSFGGNSMRDDSPSAPFNRLSRAPTADSATISSARSNLRITKSREQQNYGAGGGYGGGGGGNVFDDADSEVSDVSYEPSWSNQSQDGSVSGLGRKAPPPPPPSRAKKPPPPPPLKRSALSESQVSQY
jgi:hypothetical protein